MAFVVPVLAGSDWHSGWYYIPINTTVRIIQYRQSITFGTLAIDGLMFIEGTLILEA